MAESGEAAHGLDEIDRTLVRELVADGRATLAHLAATTGLSVSAVQSRVRRLESRGVVTGYSARVDPEAFGHCCRRSSRSPLWIRLNPTMRPRAWNTSPKSRRATRSPARRATSCSCASRRRGPGGRCCSRSDRRERAHSQHDHSKHILQRSRVSAGIHPHVLTEKFR